MFLCFLSKLGPTKDIYESGKSEYNFKEQISTNNSMYLLKLFLIPFQVTGRPLIF